MVITVKLLHAAKVAFALFTGRTANPDVINRLDLIFVEHVSGLHDSCRVNHRVVITRNINSQSAATQSVFIVVITLIGFFVIGVFNNLSVFIEVEFIWQSGKFCLCLNQCVRSFLKLNRHEGS